MLMGSIQNRSAKKKTEEFNQSVIQSKIIPLLKKYVLNKSLKPLVTGHG